MKVTMLKKVACTNSQGNKTGDFRYDFIEGSSDSNFIKKAGQRRYVVFSKFDVNELTEGSATVMHLPETDLMMSTFTNAPTMLTEDDFTNCVSIANESEKRLASLRLQSYEDVKAGSDVPKFVADKIARMSSQLTRAERNTGEVAKIKLQFAAETSRTNITQP